MQPDAYVVGCLFFHMVILLKSLPRFTASLLTFAACGLLAGPVGAQTVNWKNNTTGSWFDPANWWEGYIPGSGNNAAIDNNGDASVPFNTGVPGTAAELNVGVANTGTLRIVSGGDILANTSYIGNSSGADGTIIVNGGGSRLVLTNSISVGNGGKGLLDINAGGTVSNTYGKIGVLNGSEGSVSVAGATSAWTNANDVLVGESGTGTLGVYTGATVTSQQGFLGYNGTGNGTTYVDGVGSNWTLQSYLFVGYFGTAELNITSGGTVQTAPASTAASSAFIGHMLGSAGTVNVNGVGSTWAMKNDLNVGEQGEGTLNISNKGTVTNAYGTIGNYASGTGSVTINGAGSSWTSANDLSVGKAGTGDLMVIEGGLVESNSGYIGFSATGQGEVTIDGVGSQWNNSAALHVGYGGTGILHITSGGVVTSTDGFVGEDSGEAGAPGGTVNLNGTGSAWQLSGDLAVGDAGVGVINITAGSSVDNTDATLGVETTGNGEVNVLGGDTLWTTRGVLTVGGAGSGKVNVTTGATATASTATIGDAATGTGEVNVTGENTQWQVTNATVIGGEGQGKLNVTLGGQATTGTATLGEAEGSYGEVNVANDGTLWDVDGALTVGSAGEGLLSMTGGNVESGSTVLGSLSGGTGTATLLSGTWTNLGTLTVGAEGTGTLNLNGNGVLRVGATGTGTVVLAESVDSTGTLNIGAGDTVGTLQAATVTGGAGTAVVNFNHVGTVTFSPTLAGSLSVTKSGSGQLVLDDANTYTGDTQINDGTLLVSNTSGSATGSGKVAIGHLGTLIGDGLITGEVDINGIISPGDKNIATLSTGSQAWKNDGVYEWEIQNLDGDEGEGWDFLSIDGGLSIDSTLENPFTIMVSTLTLDGDAGLLFGFSDLQNYSWTLLTVTTQIATWTLDQIVLDLSGFTNEYVGSFSVAQSGNDLNLVYTVPEPSTGLMMALALAGYGFLSMRRRRRESPISLS